MSASFASPYLYASAYCDIVSPGSTLKETKYLHEAGGQSFCYPPVSCSSDVSPSIAMVATLIKVHRWIDIDPIMHVDSKCYFQVLYELLSCPVQVLPLPTTH